MLKQRQQLNETKYCLSYRISHFLSRSLMLTRSSPVLYTMGKRCSEISYLTHFFFFLYFFVCVQNSFKYQIWTNSISGGISGFSSPIKSGLKSQEWQLLRHRNDVSGTSGHAESGLRSALWLPTWCPGSTWPSLLECLSPGPWCNPCLYFMHQILNTVNNTDPEFVFFF